MTVNSAQRPVLPGEGNPPPTWMEEILSEYHTLKESAPYSPGWSPHKESPAYLPAWQSHVCSHRGFHSSLTRQRRWRAVVPDNGSSSGWTAWRLQSSPAPCRTSSRYGTALSWRSSVCFPPSHRASQISLGSRRNDTESPHGDTLCLRYVRWAWLSSYSVPAFLLI